MFVDKSDGSLMLALQDALLADEKAQDERVDAGCAAHSAAYDGTIATRDSANVASYRVMLHDIRNDTARKLTWKLAMWNRETYIVEVHPLSRGIFPICWRYREPSAGDAGHLVWGGLSKDDDGVWHSGQ